jgi:anti-sigma regulatory factor (Ser/Thr protein kinase)
MNDQHAHSAGASGRTSSPPTLLLDQDFDGTGLRALRSAVHAHAADLAMSERQLSHLLIIVSELASNVIRHAGGRGRLRLRRTGRTLRCEVSDDGPGIVDADRLGMAAPEIEALAGRGIWIVRQFADDLTIVTGSHGTTITAVMTLSGGADQRER